MSGRVGLPPGPRPASASDVGNQPLARQGPRPTAQHFVLLCERFVFILITFKMTLPRPAQSHVQYRNTLKETLMRSPLPRCGATACESQPGKTISVPGFGSMWA